MMKESVCRLCPRSCGADRKAGVGFCGADGHIRLGGSMLHHWEEPAISGHPERGRGTGAIFFSGCPLRCIFCQNSAISRGGTGEVVSVGALGDLFLRLEAQGAYSLDLVSPTQYAAEVIQALEVVKPRLSIPVIWNTGGYETRETVRRLAGLVDVFLTDFKYGSARTGEAYAHAADYPEVALGALREMYRITGKPVFDDFPAGEAADPHGEALFSKRLRRGIILRHLILPGERRDSVAALRLAAEAVPSRDVILALMRQYTPDFLPEEEGARYPNLKRRVTSFEYDTVRKEADRLGFSGYGQESASAAASYTPDFVRKEKQQSI